MSAQKLSLYTPSNGEWREQPGDITYVNSKGGNFPGVVQDAQHLVTNESFQVTEIPGAMSKMGWHRSAALLRKWFAYSPKNQAMNLSQKRYGINSDGSKAYRDDRFDTRSIMLDWVLSYPRTQAGFKNLQKTSYLTKGTSEKLVRTLYPYRDHDRIDTLELMRGNVRALHDNFQFQYAPVDTTALEKAEQFFGAMLHHGKPDDLAGALGGFAMYAAVAEARFRPLRISGIEIEVTKVAIYVKNPYSFFDDGKGGSQYLGHWNRDGICLVPEGYVAQHANWGNWSNYIIQPEGPYGRTFWPVHNSDFRRWQDAHNAGGDMILFSDCRVVKIDPIRFRVRK
ncbi:DUF6402 family protein [Burkholderia sp. Ax-1724]|uniref:DUF6402 family protein n=1 Tax=Burkholderia sp. Ax-1724 TaxID=2608336 RepID=UPI0014226166|nr:DUF6402 family protein [Burkholderia sp. Ax-1724]NIF54128.1 hypothetical protein [Burkholderia sp. Ax-1724]